MTVKDNTTKPELLPCPFCGKVDVRIMSAWTVNESDKDGNTVCCSAVHGGCGATGGYHIETTKAVEVWNRRA